MSKLIELTFILTIRLVMLMSSLNIGTCVINHDSVCTVENFR